MYVDHLDCHRDMTVFLMASLTSCMVVERLQSVIFFASEAASLAGVSATSFLPMLAWPGVPKISTSTPLWCSTAIVCGFLR